MGSMKFRQQAIPSRPHMQMLRGFKVKIGPLWFQYWLLLAKQGHLTQKTTAAPQKRLPQSMIA